VNPGPGTAATQNVSGKVLLVIVVPSYVERLTELLRNWATIYHEATISSKLFHVMAWL